MEQDKDPIISPEVIRQLLEGQKDEIRKRIAEAAVKEAVAGAEYALREHARELVVELFNEELREEIKAVILKAKPSILAAVEELAVGMGAQFAGAIVEHFADKMKNSWSRDKMLKAFLD